MVIIFVTGRAMAFRKRVLCVFHGCFWFTALLYKSRIIVVHHSNVSPGLR
ncbi:hypothetical protein HYZ98_01535 [Candidatus Peregrinibacteria bacterium]|nr:hypothetical protein [Candidatus Peregrinibacteria bacterium]